MSLTQATAEKLAEALHDFNPNMNVRVKPGDNDVVATITKLTMTGEEFKGLAKITGKQSVTLSRTGGKLKMVVH